MSKAEDIKALDRFIKDLNKIEDGSYFEDILNNAETIRENIRNDFMPFVGVFVKLKERNKFEDKIDTLKMKIKELQEYDIRVLKMNFKAAQKMKAEGEKEVTRLQELLTFDD